MGGGGIVINTEIIIRSTFWIWVYMHLSSHYQDTCFYSCSCIRGGMWVVFQLCHTYRVYHFATGNYFVTQKLFKQWNSSTKIWYSSSPFLGLHCGARFRQLWPLLYFIHNWLWLTLKSSYDLRFEYECTCIWVATTKIHVFIVVAAFVVACELYFNFVIRIVYTILRLATILWHKNCLSNGTHLQKYNILPPHSLASTVVRGSDSCGLYYISFITVKSKQYSRE